MYDKFVYAQDAIADFIRGLDPADSVAMYAFSRNLTRLAPLTNDHAYAISQLRQAVAGDDTALYNTLLLTVRDAAKVPGRKVVIVFSNGPDNASVLSPDDVRRVAEDEGVAIYVISTETEDPISNAVFTRLTSHTGGRYHLARRWQQQVKAFKAVREDIASYYTVTYYAAPGEAHRFRRIDVELVQPGKTRPRMNVHARSGYRPRG
jgi:Ca-activated chloride channel homolog